MRHRLTFDRSKRIELAVIALALAGLAFVAWRWMYGAPLWLYYGYIVASAAIGLTLYFTLPNLDQPLRRRLVLFLLGTSLFGAAAFRDSNQALFQIEGFFFDLLSGVFLVAVIHYLIAKIIGPLVFGRVWCSWACWTAMLLDQLPYKRDRGRLPGRWGWLRYGHFLISLGLVAGDATKCCERRVCEKVCPMDIRIADYIARGERVLSSECILCQACVNVCPEQALTLSFGFDVGTQELLRERS